MCTGASTAVVHEWVESRAGSEQVFEALAALWPDADLYALSRVPSVQLDLGGRRVRTTFLDARLTRGRRALTLPLMPLAWRAVGRDRYDLVISSHHAFAASNRLAGNGRHLVYVHSPARYVWTPGIDGRGSGRALAPARRALRAVDRRAMGRATSMAANSQAVAARVLAFWGRRSRVIHPPVDVDYFSVRSLSPSLQLPEQFLLALGRFVPYKNHEVVIEVAQQCRLPVVVAGRGPLAARLRERARLASVPVVVLDGPDRSQVRELLQRAAALVFPVEEDFGLVPVEAMAAGTPVVALGRGGASETVLDGRTGALVQEHRVDAYAAAVARALTCGPDDCRDRAQAFGANRFRTEVLSWVQESADA